MDSFTINKLLNKNKNFKGVYPKNLMPRQIGKHQGIIANTDDAEEEGEHWISIYRNKNGFIEYFDPFGIPPFHKEFIAFLLRNSTNGIGWNSHKLQCDECVTCGHYCVEFLKSRLKGRKYCNFINKFKKNTYINDKIIRKRVNWSLSLIRKNRLY